LHQNFFGVISLREFLVKSSERPDEAEYAI